MGTYIPITEKEKEEMLRAIGVSGKEELYEDIPGNMLLHKELNIPRGKSESEVLSVMKELSEKNTVFKSVFRGAGAYDRYIPAAVEYITSKEEFVTAYTPYQAEISQGVLQAIFEYQTMICELTGMDVSNASVYDGATAAAEAVAMCNGPKHDTVVLSEGLHPHVIETIQTYCLGSGLRVVKIPLKCGKTDISVLEHMLESNVAAVCIAQPNFLGQIEDTEKIGEMVKQRGVSYIVSCDLVSLGILKTPAQCGADIAVGDGQSLGLPLSFGGPSFGFMACSNKLMRKLPGRIVGETTDTNGKKAYVLTLQAREQHIRREKASSNICTNQSLCAITAAVYLSVMGTKGFEQAALQSVSKAHYLAERLSEIKGSDMHECGEFFNEFVMTSPISAEKLLSGLQEKGILGGLPLKGELEGYILWCATEKNTKEQIDELVAAIREVCA